MTVPGMESAKLTQTESRMHQKKTTSAPRAQSRTCRRKVSRCRSLSVSENPLSASDGEGLESSEEKDGAGEGCGGLYLSKENESGGTVGNS